MVEEHRDYHGKYLLTVIVASILLFSFGMILHNAFAMGAPPGTCYNEYDGPIVSFLINNGSQTFDPIANPGVTFNVNIYSNYNATFLIHTPSTSSQGNSLSGTTWYGTDAPGYVNGYCTSGGGPNQNVTVFTYHTHPANGVYSGIQSVGYNTNGFSGVSFNVNWVGPPPPPTGLKAAASSSQINLSWTAPSINGFFPVINYNIYRSTSSGTETLYATIGDVTTYSDNSVTSGQTYFYKVTAVYSPAESAPSNEASAMPFADTVTATIASGIHPWGIGVNPVTNVIYVANMGSTTTQIRSLSIIDGATNSVVSTIQGRTIPTGVGVNPVTNKIYVSDFEGGDMVTVIDGATNSVVGTIPVGGAPNGIGVNTNTNKIYVANYGGSSVSVIDGSTNSVVSTIPVGNWPREVGVNPVTNMIYVTGEHSNNVYVISGSTNSVVSTIQTGSDPYGVGVNPNTNKIYVANGSSTVSVIDGATNSVVGTIRASGPYGIGVNPNTVKIYVANSGSNNVSVIDGATNSVVSTIPVGSSPINVGINPNTNKIYITNYLSNTVSVIDDGALPNTSAAPSVPQNLQATVSSPTTINLNWTAPTNDGGSPITGYKIERSTDGGNNWSTLVANTSSTTTTYSDTGLASGVTYTYRVSAINSVGTSSPSNTVSVTTPSITLYPYWSTCCPGELSVNGNVQNPISGIYQMQILIHAPNGTLVFNQTEPTGGFQVNYMISRSDGKGNYTITGIYDGISEQKTITSIINSDPYPIISNTWEGSSGQVNIMWNVNHGIPTDKVSIVIKDPTNSTVASNTQQLCSQVNCVSTLGPFTRSGNYTILVTLLYNNATAKTSLAYTCETSSCVTPQTPPNPPSNLSTGAVSSSQINLSWTAPTNDGGSPITNYKIYRSTSSGAEILLTTVGNVTSYNDTAVTSQNYFYKVTAVNSVGESVPSNEANATPVAPATNGIVLNNIKTTFGTTSSSNQMTLASFNAGTGSNQLLLVGTSANNNNVASVTFGGIPLTKSVSSFYNNDAEFWYLKNPTGTGDIVVTMNGPTQAVVGAYSVSGVNQTSPIATHAVRHNTTPNNPTISITTKYANDWILDLPSIYGGSTLGSPTCTQQWDLNVPNAITGASSSKMVPSPGLVTCKWNASSGDMWDDVAVEIKASG